MSTWTVRVVKTRDEDDFSSTGYYFAFAEVYLDDNLLPWAYGQADTSCCESVQDLGKYLDWMQKALKEPVLSYPEDFIGTAPQA